MRVERPIFFVPSCLPSSDRYLRRSGAYGAAVNSIRSSAAAGLLTSQVSSVAYRLTTASAIEAVAADARALVSLQRASIK